MLAFMSPKRQQAYFERMGITRKARQAALDELAEVKARRVAINLGGTAVGMFGVASPIIVPNRPVTETIAVTGPEVRLAGRVEELAADVHAAGIALSELYSS